METRITVVARVKARPGKMAVLEKEIVQLMKHTHRESGCLHYSVHCGIEPADELVTIERWGARGDLDNHMKMPFLTSLLERLPDYVVGPPEIHIYRQSDTDGSPLAMFELDSPVERAG
jgi:quinol monooxygenase YgiN